MSRELDSNGIEWSGDSLTVEELQIVRTRLDSEGKRNYVPSPLPLNIGDRISSSQGRFITSLLGVAADKLGNNYNKLNFTLLQEKITGGGKIVISYDSTTLDEEHASISMIRVIQEAYSELKRYGQPTVPAPDVNIFNPTQ